MWREEPSHRREKFGTPVLSSVATLSVTWCTQLPPCCYSEWQYRGEVESEILAASNRKDSGWIKQKGIYHSNCRIRIRGCWNTWRGSDLLGPKVAKPPKPRQHTDGPISRRPLLPLTTSHQSNLALQHLLWDSLKKISPVGWAKSQPTDSKGGHSVEEFQLFGLWLLKWESTVTDHVRKVILLLWWWFYFWWWISKGGLRPATSASSENFLEKRILRPHPRSTKLEILGWGAQQSISTSPPGNSNTHQSETHCPTKNPKAT